MSWFKTVEKIEHVTADAFEKDPESFIRDGGPFDILHILTLLIYLIGAVAIILSALGLCGVI